MKIFKMRVGQFCGAIALGSLLLSSCSTTDEQYAQWNGEPTLIDAGPDRQPAPKPDAMPAPRSEVVTADGSLEPLVAAPPEPVEASYQPESVEKKKFKLFGKRDKDKDKDKMESGDMETASHVSYAGSENKQIPVVEVS